LGVVMPCIGIFESGSFDSNLLEGFQGRQQDCISNNTTR
jgi:hypothetical protein